MLTTDHLKRPSIHEILQFQSVVQWAKDLGLVIPSHEDVKSEIEQKKTEFMTTFSKMKKLELPKIEKKKKEVYVKKKVEKKPREDLKLPD